MQRILSYLLFLIAGFGVAFALLLHFYVADVVTYGYSYNEQLISGGTASHFEPRAFRVVTGPASTVMTVRQGRPSVRGGTVGVGMSNSVSAGGLFGYSSSNLYLDYRTAGIVSGPNSRGTGKAGIKWPAGARPHDYPYIDPESSIASTARFVGTGRLSGLTVRHYHVDIGTVEVTGLGALNEVADALARGNGGHRYYASAKDLWVDVATGTVVRTTEERYEYLGTRTGKIRLVLFHGRVTSTGSTVRNQVAAAHRQRDRIRFWNVVGVAAAGGGLVALLGAVLARRFPARRTGQADTFGLVFLRPWRNHPGRLALSVLGFATGVALSVAMLSFPASLTASGQRLTRFTAGADLQITSVSGAGLDARLATELRKVPGVQETSSMIQSRVYVGGTPVLLLGLDQNFVDIAESDLLSCVSTDADQGIGTGILLTKKDAQSSAAGGFVQVGVGHSRQRVHVEGELDCDLLQGVNQGHVAAAYLPVAQRLTAKSGRVDMIDVRAAPRTSLSALRDRIQTRLGGRAYVRRPKEVADQAVHSVSWLRAGMIPAVLLALIIAALLSYDVMSRSVHARRGELAMLRSIGATRPQLLLGFLGEALIMGVVGASLGLGGGSALTYLFVSNTPPILSEAVGLSPVTVIPTWVLLACFVSGVVVVVAGALLPARVALSIPPADASGGRADVRYGKDLRARPVIMIVGLCVTIAGAVAAWYARGTAATLAIALPLLGAVLLSFGGAAYFAWLSSAIARRLGRTGMIAAAALARFPRRSWATMMVVALAVSAMIAISGLVNSQVASLRSTFGSFAESDVWVTTAPLEYGFPVRPVEPQGAERRLRSVPGVAGVVSGQGDFLAGPGSGGQILVVATENGSHSPYLQHISEPAWKSVMHGDAVVLSQAAARRLGTTAGKVVRIPTVSGARPIRVAQVVPDLETTLYQGSMVISGPLYQRWTGRTGATWFEIRLAPSADPAATRTAIGRALAGYPAPVHTYSGRGAVQAIEQSVAQAGTLVTDIQWVVLLCVGLLLMNTFTVTVLERRRELATLMSIGSTRRQLLMTILHEATAIGVVGVLYGVLVGLVLQRAGLGIMMQILGTQVDYHPAPAWILATASGALTVVVASAALPGWRAVRGSADRAVTEE